MLAIAISWLLGNQRYHDFAWMREWQAWGGWSP